MTRFTLVRACAALSGTFVTIWCPIIIFPPKLSPVLSPESCQSSYYLLLDWRFFVANQRKRNANIREFKSKWTPSKVTFDWSANRVRINLGKLLLRRLAAFSLYTLQCLSAFAELQTDMTDLTADLESSGIPTLDHNEYILKVFFPGVRDHPILTDPKVGTILILFILFSPLKYWKQ